MISIFAFTRPFVGEFDLLQRNAIKSWINCCPGCQIVLFKDEEGTAFKVANEFDLKCVDTECNEFGTPLFTNLFGIIKKESKFDTAALISTDIILLEDFFKTVIRIHGIMGTKQFFAAGRRWDVDINEEIDFNNSNWRKNLLNKVDAKGKLHGFAALDYWVFPKNLDIFFLPFAVGRPGCDAWMIYKSRITNVPVIDMTSAVRAIHENHNYPHAEKDFFEIEKQRNLKLAGGFKNMITLREADWIYADNELKRPKFPRNILSLLILFYPWRVFYASVRIIRKKLFFRT